MLSLYNVTCMCVFMDNCRHWTANWCGLLLGPSPLLVFLGCLGSGSRVEDSAAFLHPVWHVPSCHCCLAHVCLVMLVRIYGYRF